LTTGLELLNLPPGFSYRSFSWTGEKMTDGLRTPGLHDGMGLFATNGRIHLVRNHEITVGTPFGGPIYDASSAGGTTTLEFDPTTGHWLGSRASLSGTHKNCAGGVTPWGTWLSCEESTADPGTKGVERTHGWVFEVPPTDMAQAKPLEALGRFEHEAVAFDPATGVGYLTEDSRRAGLYRFVPRAYGDLESGRLQMLCIDRALRLPTRIAREDDWMPIGWVDIEDPTATELSVYEQGSRKNGATFKRLEGIWFDGGRVFFASTTGGWARAGQIWELDLERQRLRLTFQSPGTKVLSGPDNLAMMESGAMVICEDGDHIPSRLSMLTDKGVLFPIAENNLVFNGERGLFGDFRHAEWCGACSSGEWLFANLQIPGLTLAITGPWGDLG
jgi:secreted PhoX family phosphatase